MRDAAPPRPRGRPSRRAALLAAAIEVLHRRGIRDMTLEEVSSASGLTRGAIYWHFTSKERLVEEALAATVLPLERLKRRMGEEACLTLARAVADCVREERHRGFCLTLLFNAAEPAARARMARIRLAVTRFLARACVERARGPRDEVRRHRLRLAQAFVLGALIELMGAEMRQRVDERELAASLRALVARPCVALHGADGAMSGA